MTEIINNSPNNNAFSGPIVSATIPIMKANTAKKRLPASALSEPIVARCLSVNSLWSKVWLAVVPTPKKNELTEISKYPLNCLNI